MKFPLLLASVVFITAVAPSLAAPGDLDLSFGGGTGRVTTTLSSANGVALQTDGKIVVVGTGSNGTHTDFVVARYLTDGAPDTSFNSTGTVMTDVSGTDTARAVVVQADGKIVVLGTSDQQVFEQTMGLVRYLPDGALDTSFGGTGKVIVRIGTSLDSAKALALQADGKIIIVGLTNIGGTVNYVVARLRTDGTFDTTFNATGKVTGRYASGDSGAYSVRVQPDGKILVGGAVGNAVTLRDFAIARYNTNGTLDKTFNRTGKVLTKMNTAYSGGAINDLAIQDDGKIVGVGPADTPTVSSFGIVRYTVGGKLDLAFNGTGKVITEFPRAPGDISLFNEPSSVALQGDGRILVAGVNEGLNRASYSFCLMRYGADGQQDETFHGGSRFLSSIGTDIPPAWQGLAIQGDGKFVCVACSKTQVELLRLLGDPQVDVATDTASDITASSVVLHGTLNPEGEANASAVFEWGTSPGQLTNTTAPIAISGTDPVAVQAPLAGLARGTVFYYRLRGDHPPYGSQRGEVLNFATISNHAPGVISQPASLIVTDGAQLNASVNPNSLATSGYFEWGATTSYGNATADANLGSGTVPGPLNASLTGLTTDQTYHYRAVATSEAGTTFGPDRTFTPSAGAPQPQDDVVLIDGVATIRVLDNDSDPNGDVLSLVGLDPEALPSSGTAQTVGNLVFYTPVDGMLQDEFGYIAQDATGKQAKARVRAYRLSEIRGQYFGVISDAAGNGQLNMEIAPSGAFSLLLTWQGFDYALKGRLDGDRSFITGLPRKGVEPNALLLLELQFDPLSGQITAQLTDSVLGGPFTFDAPRGGDADEAVDAVRGQLYTTTIDVPDSVIALPEGAVPAALNPFADKFRGSGFASVKIAKNRSARFVGQMPDTAKFSAGSPVSRRTYALYSALYQAKTGALGSVSGRATLQSNFELRGTSLTWQREADDRDEIFNGAFNTPAFLNGDRYTPPTRGQLMQIGLELLSGAFSNAKLNMTLGGLAPELQQALKFIPGSVRVVGENPSGVKLRISPTTGTFAGSFLHTVSQETTKFSGIFITSPFQIREGRGSFRGVGAGGKVRIAKP